MYLFHLKIFELDITHYTDEMGSEEFSTKDMFDVLISYYHKYGWIQGPNAAKR